MHARQFDHNNIFEKRLSTRDDCIPADPADTVTTRLNTLMSSSGPGYILSLCPDTEYFIQAPILFAAPHQEISTAGYPTGDDRATLVVSGALTNGAGQTTAVDGTCSNCTGVILRNIQINGARDGGSPVFGGANIEMGGPNSNQLIEYVHSYDPRGWSCLHVAEGNLNCNNVTVQNNDIGPCGSDSFQQWADGISMSCLNGVVRNNMVNNPTDGGIVIFGAPGTIVENNTIWVESQTLLGGINMVDYEPWGGNYTGTIVRNNTILGGFSTDQSDVDETKGANAEDIVIKIGIAVGPHTWFGSEYGSNVSFSGTVLNNRLSGAFSYAIAATSARNFTIQDNVLFGNTSFIGASGPNCTTGDVVPTPAAMVYQKNNTIDSSLQSDFQTIIDGDALTCVMPPAGGDYWPFGGNPSSPGPPTSSTPTPPSKTSGDKVGLVAGVVLGLLFAALGAWFLRKWALKRSEANRLYSASRSGYIRSKDGH